MHFSTIGEVLFFIQQRLHLKVVDAYRYGSNGPKHLLNEKKSLWRMSRTLKGMHNSKSRQIVYLCESEATATNVFCSESEAAATNVFCSESEAAATNVFCSESEAAATITPRHIGSIAY